MSTAANGDSAGTAWFHLPGEAPLQGMRASGSVGPPCAAEPPKLVGGPEQPPLLCLSVRGLQLGRRLLFASLPAISRMIVRVSSAAFFGGSAVSAMLQTSLVMSWSIFFSPQTLPFATVM